MFRKSKANEISNFFDLHLNDNELAIFYLGVSGFLTRSAKHAVLFDPAGFLKNEETKGLKFVNLLLFTHNHLDHFKAATAQAIFKASDTAILAEPKVADKLKGKIPAEKLVYAEPRKTYAFGDVTVTAIVGIHKGPIMLYQTKMDGITLFHAGDSGYVTLTDYPSDVAFLPTGRMSPTASPENAYKMAVDLKPQVIIPMHGSEKQKQQLQQKVKDGIPQTTVLIIEPYTLQTVVLQSRS